MYEMFTVVQNNIVVFCSILDYRIATGTVPVLVPVPYCNYKKVNGYCLYLYTVPYGTLKDINFGTILEIRTYDS